MPYNLKSIAILYWRIYIQGIWGIMTLARKWEVNVNEPLGSVKVGKGDNTRR